MMRILGIIICCLSFLHTKAQCDFSKDRKNPDIQYVASKVGGTFEQWRFDIGREKDVYFIRLFVEPGFVTVNESFKKKKPMTPDDALILKFASADSIVLHPVANIEPVLESFGPGGTASVWRYPVRLTVDKEVIYKLRYSKLRDIVIEMDGKKKSRGVKRRQQLDINDAAKCIW